MLRPACIFFILAFSECAAFAGEPLPLPASSILPNSPSLYPSVVTSDGQRLLLSDTNAILSWDSKTGTLSGNHAGWELINYPLRKIRGLEDKTEDQIAMLLTGLPANQLKNWWVQLPGVSDEKTTLLSGPSPVTLTQGTVIVVDQNHPMAKDDQEGSPSHPFATITAALRHLQPGSVVRIMPGLYRETITVKVAGTAEQPIIIEGVRDASGRMPIITGNDLIAPQSWKPVPDLAGVYRTPLPGDTPGPVSANGELLEEIDCVPQMSAGQFAVNRSSHEFAFPRLTGKEEPKAGEQTSNEPWSEIVANEQGFLTLPRGNSTYYFSTWVWVDPKERENGEIFDPTAPRPISGEMRVTGRFRSYRQTGSTMESQVNQYRIWLNGEALLTVPRRDKPSPSDAYSASEDVWNKFALAEGWNHLLIQFDTTTRPKDLTIRMQMPPRVGKVICVSQKPDNLTKAPTGLTPSPYLTCGLLLGPFAAQPDHAIYVRLDHNDSPANAVMDMGVRGMAVDLQTPFVQVRGLELRHGTQFQQRALVRLAARGDQLEGCLIRDTEWNGINLDLAGDDISAAPIVVRGNWILNAGAVGISANGDTKQLNAQNLAAAPGRRPALIEWNHIINSNRRGHDRWWESGSMKLLRVSGVVIRQNELVGGYGPGIWLDWENYGVRVEGNRSDGVVGFLAGVEASPGPVLIGSNIAINTRPGGVWFRYGILSWSSTQVWAVNNTIDGRWNNEIAGWKDQDGADGIYLDEGPDDRKTHWGALLTRRYVVANNIVIGCDEGIRTESAERYQLVNNIEQTARNVTSTIFRAAKQSDYRQADTKPTTGSAAYPEIKTLHYDFYGRPIGQSFGYPIGACRLNQPISAGAEAKIEVETANGTFKRIANR